MQGVGSLAAACPAGGGPVVGLQAGSGAIPNPPKALKSLDKEKEAQGEQAAPC